jgi:predicted nucleotidyltransferase component of viral defense system
MIPSMNIIAWANVAPWAEQRQIEQDLIISRALIEIFNDEFLKTELRLRGGTALNKLHFPAPLRYSEDIDLVRTTEGPIGPILDRIREILRPWLGDAAFEQSPVAPKLVYSADAEDNGPPLRLKIEINTRERAIYDQPKDFLHQVENSWFSGQALVPSFSNEEMLATKLRALLQRDKGRDLFDISHALSVFHDLDAEYVAALFSQYLQAQGLRISRAQAEERMFAKLASPGFLSDVRPLLAAEQADRLTNRTMKTAFADVLTRLVGDLSGERWARTEEMLERFGIDVSR